VALPLCLHLLVGLRALSLSKVLKLIIPGVVTFILLGLSYWQVSRYFEAIDLQNHAKSQTQIARQQFNPDQKYHDLTPVTLNGHFDYGQEIMLLSKTYQGKNGFVLIAPFYLSDGKVIMVNRGWTAQMQDVSYPEGDLELQGVMRKFPSEKGWLTPDNTEKAWFSIDYNDLKSHWNVDLLQEYVAIDHPQDGLMPHYQYTLKTRDPAKHLGYALTWFFLAVSLIIMTFFWIRKSRAKIRSSLGRSTDNTLEWSQDCDRKTGGYPNRSTWPMGRIRQPR